MKTVKISFNKGNEIAQIADLKIYGETQCVRSNKTLESVTKATSSSTTATKTVQLSSNSFNITNEADTNKTSYHSSSKSKSQISDASLGIVPACTLDNPVFIYLEEKSEILIYCFSEIGEMSQTEGVKRCKDLNAKLPVPRNNIEARYFAERSRHSSLTKTWLGITDQSQSGNLRNWINIYTGENVTETKQGSITR